MAAPMTEAQRSELAGLVAADIVVPVSQVEAAAVPTPDQPLQPGPGLKTPKQANGDIRDQTAGLLGTVPAWATVDIDNIGTKVSDILKPLAVRRAEEAAARKVSSGQGQTETAPKQRRTIEDLSDEEVKHYADRFAQEEISRGLYDETTTDDDEDTAFLDDPNQEYIVSDEAIA